MPALLAALLRLMSTFDPDALDADEDEEDTPWGMAVRRPQLWGGHAR